MRNFFDRFKIPTLLGLSIIFIGIITGVFLTLREQTFTSKASPSISAQNITISNISDNEVTISWQTATPTPSFIAFGQASPDEITVLDDRDAHTPPQTHLMHYVTIKNLLPKTTYQYKIISGQIQSEVSNFTTAAPLSQQAGLSPIIGSVLDGDRPLVEGIVYLSIPEAIIQSALVKSSGNFLIPISKLRKIDLSDSFPLTEDTLIKLTIISAKGQTNAIFTLKDVPQGLPSIKLGQDLDLTNVVEENKYDLNGDGKINSTDYAIILQNLGKNPKNPKADLNGDGIVDQKDLDLMSKKINQ